MSELSNPFPHGSKIIAYLRDSGGPEQDLSVIQQEEYVQDWADRHGLRLIRSFRDEARKGSSDIPRDGFLDMIAHFRNGAEETGIVIWKWSRFARSVDDSQFYRADLRRRGFIIHSLKDEIPEGPNGRLFEAAIDWMNERFLEDLSTDIRRALQRNLQKYGAVGGSIPIGFRAVEIDLGRRRDGTPHIVHRREPDPAMIDTIRLAWKMRADGATYSQIEKATGLFTKDASWYRFFTNTIYIGELHYGSEVIKDYCEPIIDRSTWDAVRAVSEARKPKHLTGNHPRRVASRSMLSGIIFCQQCGRRMSVTRVASWNYYICARRAKDGTCHARRIPMKVIDEAITKEASDHILDIENLLSVQARLRENIGHEQVHNEQQRIRLSRDLDAVTREINNLMAAIRSYGHSPALLNELARSEKSSADLHKKLSNLHSQPEPAYHDSASLAELAADLQRRLADPQERKAVIQRIFTRIVVTRTDNKVIGIAYLAPMKLLGLPEFREAQLDNRGGGSTALQTDYLIHFTILVKKYTTSRKD
jgi:site-specific DNA recombinase